VTVILTVDEMTGANFQELTVTPLTDAQIRRTKPTVKTLRLNDGEPWCTLHNIAVPVNRRNVYNSVPKLEEQLQIGHFLLAKRCYQPDAESCLESVLGAF
jgi:hypothetical protein